MPGSNTLKLNPDGTVSPLPGLGRPQLHARDLERVAGGELGVGLEKVGVLTGDTDVAPVAPLSARKQHPRSMGMTVKVAAEKLRQQILEVTAGQFKANIDDLEIVGPGPGQRHAGSGMTLVMSTKWRRCSGWPTDSVGLRVHARHHAAILFTGR